jgi:hypothetical protein
MALPPYKVDPGKFRAATVYLRDTGPAPAKKENEQLTHKNVFLHNHLTNTGEVGIMHTHGVYQKPSGKTKTGGKGTNSESSEQSGIFRRLAFT